MMFICIWQSQWDEFTVIYFAHDSKNVIVMYTTFPQKY